jgi:hypothetical protein
VETQSEQVEREVNTTSSQHKFNKVVDEVVDTTSSNKLEKFNKLNTGVREMIEQVKSRE